MPNGVKLVNCRTCDVALLFFATSLKRQVPQVWSENWGTFNSWARKKAANNKLRGLAVSGLIRLF